MNFSIIIPNYNGINLLKKNLPIISKIFRNQEIIISDDLSQDDSLEYIRKTFPNFKIIINTKNCGFSTTVNKAVENCKNDLFLLLNSDAFPNKFNYDVINKFNDDKLFALGFLQIENKNKKSSRSGRGTGRFQKGFLYHQKGNTNKYNTLWASGGSAIFRKSIWNKLGGLYEIYNPFYWEDIDICYRAWKCGYKIFFDNQNSFFHIQHDSSIRLAYKSEFIKKISYRNQIYFVWCNITDINYLLQHLVYLPIHLIQSILRRDYVFITAFFEAIQNIKQILRYRCFNKSIFKLKDNEIFQLFRE
jgi:GT2 family glycosyltransferase